MGVFNRKKRVRNPRIKKELEGIAKPRPAPEETVDETFTDRIDENLGKFKKYLQDSSDIVFREFRMAENNTKCALVYVDGLVDRTVIHEHIMLPLMIGMAYLRGEDGNQPKTNALESVKQRVVGVAEIKEVQDFDTAMLMMMSGETVLLVDGSSSVLVLNTRGWKIRGPEEPETETLIRGPREGFTESIRTNTALLRRRCRDVNMVIKVVRIGRRSKTDVAIVYVKGIVNPELAGEVVNRLKKVDVDAILETGQLEQLIQDSHLSPFPQAQSTERPDKAVSSMLEGRVVILGDGTPFALIVPAGFYQFLQSPEDYYERWIAGTLLRLLRLMASFISIYLPAVYVSLVAFHPGMLPRDLAISIAASRERVPFPVFVEAFLMEVTIEFLREAGVRLPKPIGQTIGIVGGIIIGDAAVRAGITSPIMVMVISITAISTFAIPTYSAALGYRVLRFAAMLAASVFGLYGVLLFYLILKIHIANLRSFGINYASPVFPIWFRDLKDIFIRVPSVYMDRRPEYLYPVDMIRADTGEIRRG